MVAVAPGQALNLLWLLTIKETNSTPTGGNENGLTQLIISHSEKLTSCRNSLARDTEHCFLGSTKPTVVTRVSHVG